MTCIGGLLNTVTGSVILTADEVKEVEGHIDQLNAENARLRSCLSDDAENAKLIMAENAKLCAEVERLRGEYMKLAQVNIALDSDNTELRNDMRDMQMFVNENAKLRKLLSSYWKAVHSPVTPNIPRDYLKEMRELGIEVDE